MDPIEMSHSRRVSSDLRISTPASLSLSKPASPTQFDSSAFDTFDHLSIDVTTPAEFTNTPNTNSVKPSSITSSPESSAVNGNRSHRRRSSAGDVSNVVLHAATPTSTSNQNTPPSSKPINSQHRSSHSVSQSKQPSARNSPVVSASPSLRGSPKTVGKRIPTETKSNHATPPQQQPQQHAAHRSHSPSSARSIHSGQSTPEPLSARSHAHSRNNSISISAHSPTLTASNKSKLHKADKDVHLHQPPTLSSRRPSIGSGSNVVAPHSIPTGGALSSSKKGHVRTDSRLPPHASPAAAHRGHTASLMQYPSPPQSSVQAKQSLKKAVQAVGITSKFGRSTPATPGSRPETPSVATPIATAAGAASTPHTPYDPTQYTLLLTPQLERDLDARSLHKGRKILQRSVSFGALNKRVAASWAMREAREKMKAETSFQVTQLQQEKAQLQHDLEQAKLIISDLRYAAYRKEMATEKVVADLKEEVEVAEATLTDMKMKYLEQRRSVYSYRFLLIRNAILSFVHRYKLKRRMKHLYTDMRELVIMIEREKKEAAITNDVGLLLPQAETKEYLLSSEKLWENTSQSLFFISTERLMLNLKDGLETVRMAMSNSLHISAALRDTADKMFERNTAVMSDALQLREDLSTLNIGRDHLWKEPMLLPRVLDRMKHEEEMKEKRKEKQAVQDKKDAALRAVLAPRSPSSTNKSFSRPSSARIARNRDNAMAMAYAHSTTVSPTRENGSDNIVSSNSLQYSASVHLPLPRPSNSATASRRNLLHSSTSRASIIAAAVAASAVADQEAKAAGAGPSKEEMNDPHRATPRSPASAPRSSVQKIQLSSTGFAYRHYRSELKSSKQKKEERDRKIMAEVIAKAEEEAARQHQLQMEEQKRQEEEEKKIIAARKAARKPKPPPTAFHANYANFYLRRHPDIDDDMMLGWRDDSDEEEPYCNKRVLHTITAVEPDKIITEFAEPPKPRRRGKVMFQYAVAQVIRQQRQKFASFKAAMSTYKKMDVDNFEIDMQELDDWQPEELYN